MEKNGNDQGKEYYTVGLILRVLLAADHQPKAILTAIRRSSGPCSEPAGLSPMPGRRVRLERIAS